MFCNHVAYNLAKAERRKLLFAVTEKIDNMAKKKLTIKGTLTIMNLYQVCNCTAGINLTWTLF